VAPVFLMLPEVSHTKIYLKTTVPSCKYVKVFPSPQEPPDMVSRPSSKVKMARGITNHAVLLI
jgi:phage FluMu protein Com